MERGRQGDGKLLAFSRIQRLVLAPVDINRLIAAMADLLARSLGPKIEIAMDFDESIGPAQADANQLELAILNLAINARDAMPDGGRLTIATTREDIGAEGDLASGRFVVVTVTDTGTGMPSEVLDRAFEPFFTTKEIGEGTGLGLSQVYGIARQSGGTVKIESMLGRGTSVRVLLPAASGVAVVPEDLDLDFTDDDAAQGHREIVLVVDDDPDVRHFLIESLLALGYRVAEAAHGRAGLEALDRSHPDVMILDYAMPGMTGAEVALEARRRQPELPILFTTGYADMAALRGPAGAAQALPPGGTGPRRR